MMPVSARIELQEKLRTVIKRAVKYDAATWEDIIFLLMRILAELGEKYDYDWQAANLRAAFDCARRDGIIKFNP